MKTDAWTIAPPHTLELRRLSLAVVLGILIVGAPRAGADDAAMEFGGFNPTLHWSYGWSASPGSAFNPFTTFAATIDGVDSWSASNKAAIGHNCTMSYSSHQHGATLPPRSLSLWPGSTGQSSVLRWTAPATGTYRIEATFRGLAGYPVLSPDWIRPGSQQGAEFGYSIAGAGDVNGDGYDDVIVGEPFYTNGQTNEGRVLLYLGSGGGFSSTPAWTFESNQAGARLGTSVASAGDVNGDGYADVVVGAPLFDTTGPTLTDAGEIHVFLGSPAGLPASPSWSAFGNASSYGMGTSVASEDVNGDGDTDILVGAAISSASQSHALAWFGGASGLGPTGTPSNADWILASVGLFGASIACAGDINGDGYHDVIVGAPLLGTAQEGVALVYYGSAAGPATTASWTAESNQGSAELGYSVASAGDVNGDGYDDILVGAPYYFNPDFHEGKAFIWLGSATGLGPSGTPLNAAWSAESNQGSAELGYSVASAGDVNGDGYGDILVGAPLFDNGQVNEGKAFLWLGSATGLGAAGTPANADWSAESNQAGAQFGFAVAAAGNVDGDLATDLLVAAPLYTTGISGAGQAYAYFDAVPAPQPITTTAVAILKNSVQIASGSINIGGAGDSATFTSTQSVPAGGTIDFVVSDGGNGRAFDATGLDALILPAQDPNGPAYGFLGQRFVAARGGPGMDGAAFDPVHQRLVTRGNIYDLCGNLISAGPGANVGVSWDPESLKVWELIDDNANARWVMRRWNGAALLDTVFTIPRVLSVPGTGADTIEDVRGIAVDSNFVYLVDAGPAVEPRQNGWFKFTRAGAAVKSLKLGAFAVNSTGDIVDDIVYAPFSCPTAPGRLLVCIEHSGLMEFDTEGGLVGTFLWNEQFVTRLERPSAFAGLTLDPATGNLYLVDNDAGALQVWTRLPDAGPTTYVIGSGEDGGRLQLPNPTCNLPIWSVLPAPCGPVYPFGIAYRPANNRVYGCDYGGDLWRFDPRSWRGQLVGTTGANLVWGMAYDPERDVLYGHSQADGRIWAINPNTGAGTPLPNAVGFNLSDIAFVPGTGRIYGVEYGGSRLIVIDRDTGTGSVVGPTVSPIIGIDWDATRDRLVGMAQNGTSLYAINAGTGSYSQIATVSTNIGWEGLAVIPVAAAPTVGVQAGPLSWPNTSLRAWPNPFRDELTLRFALPAAAPVDARVFDVAGRLVRRLSSEPMVPGEHILRWDGHDGDGHRASPGIYFLRLQSGGRTVSTRAVLLK